MNINDDILLETNNCTLFGDGSILCKYGFYSKGDKITPFTNQEEADSYMNNKYNDIKQLAVIAEIDDFGKVSIQDKMWHRIERLDKCPVCGGEEELYMDINGLGTRCKICNQPMNLGMLNR